MSSTTSITASERTGTSGSRRFFRSLLSFLLPYALVGITATALLQATGELISVDTVARMQMLGLPFIYQSRLSDHTYRLKVTAARARQPDVVVLGPSRMLQWRSAMFRPYSFYNAGQVANTQADFRRFLDDVGYAPKIVLFSLEFFTLHPEWDAIFRNRSYVDRGGFGSGEQATILRGLWPLIRQDPRLLVRWPREPVYGLRAFGLRAVETGAGLRPDGSFHYGGIIAGWRGQGNDSVEETLSRVRVGAPPFPSADHLDVDQMREVERFARLARERGIRLICITPPHAAEVVEALDRSPLHGNWRQFQSAATADWIRAQGMLYFNFTRLESFAGRREEFVDPFHPSEPASVRMLLAMRRDPTFRRWLPAIDETDLQRHLAAASRYEAYRNEY